MRSLRTLTTRRILAVLLVGSAVSCLAMPRGWAWPRNLAGPLLAPLSHAGTYVGLRVARNVRALGGETIDDELAERLLVEHEPIRRRLLAQQDRQTLDRLAALERQVVAYEQLVAGLQEQLTDTRGWSGALQEFPCMLVPAVVIGGDASVHRDSRLVRRFGPAPVGSAVTTRDLVTQRPTALPLEMGGLAVLSQTCLVGRVVQSGAWCARVQTILDEGFRSAAIVYRDPANPREIEVDVQEGGRRVPIRKALEPDDPAVPVVVHGQGTDRMLSDELPARVNILPGDLVGTPGMGRGLLLPPGIVLGRVVEVIPVANNPSHVRLSIEPAVPLETVERVYIVIPKWEQNR